MGSAAYIHSMFYGMAVIPVMIKTGGAVILMNYDSSAGINGEKTESKNELPKQLIF